MSQCQGPVSLCILKHCLNWQWATFFSPPFNSVMWNPVGESEWIVMGSEEFVYFSNCEAVRVKVYVLMGILGHSERGQSCGCMCIARFSEV